jgi:TRAP-type uncharacterized transport system fused permease subunit
VPAGFIVPSVFVYEPAILLIGDWPTILKACVTATFGILMLAAGPSHGYFLRRATMSERVLSIAAAFALVYPHVVADLVGFGTRCAGRGDARSLKPAERPACA